MQCYSFLVVLDIIYNLLSTESSSVYGSLGTLCISCSIINYLYFITMGPSIYDVHTEGAGGQAQVDACGRGVGPALGLCGRPHRKLKLESTDGHPVFFSCKEVGVFFFTRISSLAEKNWKFFCD